MTLCSSTLLYERVAQVWLIVKFCPSPPREVGRYEHLYPPLSADLFFAKENALQQYIL